MAEVSGFEVLALLKELNFSLHGTYLNNIYTAGGSQIFRLRKPNAEDVWLVVSPKKGVWISKDVKDRAETGETTTKLRGELERAKFVEATQIDLDRVFVLKFEARGAKSLIVEMMPPGNLIVTDENEKVVIVENEVRAANRKVARGFAYAAPKSSRLSPLDVSVSDVSEMLDQEDTVGKAVGRHVALPRKYVAECLARLGVSDDAPSSTMAGKEDDVVRVIKEMVDEARDPKPCLVETSQGDDIFVITPLKLKVKKTAQTVSELCDELLLNEATAQVEVQPPEENKRKELEVTVSRLRAESKGRMEEAARARAGAQTARASPLVDAMKILRDSGIRTTRELSSPAAVASALYDHAKALEAKSAAALESANALEKGSRRIKKRAPPKRKLLPNRKQEWFEKFRWFNTSRGKLALGGRDAQSNSNLISRHLEEHDTVYHADLFGSPFFILKGGEGQDEQETREVSQATVAFSSAWKTGLGSADAYWVRPDQVSSAAPSGEYLARGSFAIKGKKSFVTKNMVEIAIGIDANGRILSGPENALMSQAKRYVVLRPHREKASDTAKQVLRELSSSAEGPGTLNLDEVLRALPAGGGKVVRRASGSS